MKKELLGTIVLARRCVDCFDNEAWEYNDGIPRLNRAQKSLLARIIHEALRVERNRRRK